MTTTKSVIIVASLAFLGVMLYQCRIFQYPRRKGAYLNGDFVEMK